MVHSGICILVPDTLIPLNYYNYSEMPKIVLTLITIVLIINVMILLSGPLRLPSFLSLSEPSSKTLIRGRRAFDIYDFGRLERGNDGWYTQYLF